MTFHRTLLALRRGPLAAGHRRAAALGTKTVSFFAPPSAMSVRAVSTVKMSSDWVSDSASLSPARAKLQNVLEEYRRNKYVCTTHLQYHVLHHSSAIPISFVLTSLSLSLSFFCSFYLYIYLLQFQSDALFSLSQGNDPSH
jgi:hypothetical protein